jgi:hypothetical protein
LPFDQSYIITVVVIAVIIIATGHIPSIVHAKAEA